MNKILTIFILISALAAVQKLTASPIHQKYLKIGSLQVNYTVIEPAGRSIGDVLYLHGYGDSFTNHFPLFKEWTLKGFRVVAFDFPSHGLTSGRDKDDLDWHSFESLAHLARQVLSASSSTNNEVRPLIIAGWSTGGLLAIRIAQVPGLRQLFPSLKGLVLYAPAVSTWKCPGNHICKITNETLTHNQELYDRGITPEYPLARLGFAFHLFMDGIKSWKNPIPKDIPTLVFIAGDNSDHYAKSVKLKHWVQYQQTQHTAPLQAIQCVYARHELDNEPQEYGGILVRKVSASFAYSVIEDKKPEVGQFLNSSCYLVQSANHK